MLNNTSCALQLNVVVSDNAQKELFVPAPDTPQSKLHQELLLNLLGKDLATTPIGLQSPGMPFSPSLTDLLASSGQLTPQLTPQITHPHPFAVESKTLLPTPLGFGPLVSSTMSPFNSAKLSVNSCFASPAPKKFTFDIDDGMHDWVGTAKEQS